MAKSTMPLNVDLLDFLLSIKVEDVKITYNIVTSMPMIYRITFKIKNTCILFTSLHYLYTCLQPVNIDR